MTVNTFKTHRPKNFLKILLMGTVTTVLLGACTVHQPSYGPTQLRNKITVAETVERMELYVQPTGLNLSARDRDAMGNFVEKYAQFGEGPLYINVPSSALNGKGINQAKHMINQQLAHYGRGENSLQIGRYAASPSAPAPVIVSYRRLAIAPIDCQQGAQLANTANNQPYANFGCAQTANLAAMIDNPRQLLQPYTLENVPAERRTTVVDKYIKGQATASPRPAEQKISAGGN